VEAAGSTEAIEKAASPQSSSSSETHQIQLYVQQTWSKFLDFFMVLSRPVRVSEVSAMIAQDKEYGMGAMFREVGEQIPKANAALVQCVDGLRERIAKVGDAAARGAASAGAAVMEGAATAGRDVPDILALDPDEEVRVDPDEDVSVAAMFRETLSPETGATVRRYVDSVRTQIQQASDAALKGAREDVPQLLALGPDDKEVSLPVNEDVSMAGMFREAAGYFRFNDEDGKKSEDKTQMGWVSADQEP